MTPANKITAELLIEIPKFFHCRVWRNNRVKAMVTGRGGKPRMVDAGIDGQADISGILAPSGKRIEVEVKAPGDRQSEVQKAFQAMIQSHGGIYIVATSVKQCLEEMQKI